MRRSNQLSYKATNSENWSFVGSNVPVMNESMDKMILNCGFRPFKKTSLGNIAFPIVTSISLTLHCTYAKYSIK